MLRDRGLEVIAAGHVHTTVVPDQGREVTTPEAGRGREVIRAIEGDIEEAASGAATTIAAHITNPVSKTQGIIKEAGEADITITEILGTTIEIIAVGEGLILTTTAAVADPEEDIKEEVIGITGIAGTIEAAQETEADRTAEAAIVTLTTPP